MVQEVRRAFILERDITNHLTQDTGLTPHGNVHWIVPRVVNDLFTGRVELLSRIQQALHNDYASSNNRQRRFVITGLGGQGKSEICLKIANSMREKYVLIIFLLVELL